MQCMEQYISKVKEQGNFVEMVKVNSETMVEAYVKFERDLIERHKQSLPEHVSPEIVDEDAVFEDALNIVRDKKEYVCALK